MNARMESINIPKRIRAITPSSPNITLFSFFTNPIPTSQSTNIIGFAFIVPSYQLMSMAIATNPKDDLICLFNQIRGTYFGITGSGISYIAIFPYLSVDNTVKIYFALPTSPDTITLCDLIKLLSRLVSAQAFFESVLQNPI